MMPPCGVPIVVGSSAPSSTDAAWDGAMVARWSASPLGMLWPESDAACVVAGGDGGVLPAAARRPVVIIAAS